MATSSLFFPSTPWDNGHALNKDTPVGITVATVIRATATGTITKVRVPIAPEMSGSYFEAFVVTPDDIYWPQFYEGNQTIDDTITPGLLAFGDLPFISEPQMFEVDVTPLEVTTGSIFIVGFFNSAGYYYAWGNLANGWFSNAEGTLELVQTGDPDADVENNNYNVNGRFQYATGDNWSLWPKNSYNGGVYYADVVFDDNESGTGYNVSGTVTVTSTVTGAPNKRTQVSGTVPVVSTVSGNTIRRTNLSGSVPVVSTVVGSIRARRVVSGSVPVTSNSSGALYRQQLISGVVDILSTVSGYVSSELELYGTVVVNSGVSGDFFKNSTLGGVIPVTSTVSGYMFAGSSLAGTVQIVSGSAGSLFRNTSVNGVVNIVSTSNGSVNVRAALNGVVQIISEAYGNLGFNGVIIIPDNRTLIFVGGNTITNSERVLRYGEPSRTLREGRP